MTVSRATYGSQVYHLLVGGAPKKPPRPTAPPPPIPTCQGRVGVSPYIPNIPITPFNVKEYESLVQSALSIMDSLIKSMPQGDKIADVVVEDLLHASANLQDVSKQLMSGKKLELRERPIDELLSRAYLYDNPQHSQVKELVGTLNNLGLTLSFEKIVNKSNDLITQSWVNSLRNSFAKNTQVDIVNGVVEFLVKVKDPFIVEGVLKSLSGDQVNWVSSVNGWYEFMVSQKPIDRKLAESEKVFIRQIVNAAGELGITISKPDEPREMYRSPSKRK